MSFTGGPSTRTRTDASAYQVASGDGGTTNFIRAGQKSTVLGQGASLYKIGKGANPEFHFTTNVTDGGIFGAGANLLKSALESQAGLAETKITGGANLTGKYTTVAVVALGLIAMAAFYLRRK